MREAGPEKERAPRDEIAMRAPWVSNAFGQEVQSLQAFTADA
jgi:hypothetical protein